MPGPLERIRYEGPIFSVVESPVEGIPKFSKVVHPGAVAVLPYDHHSLYLTKQFRPAIGRSVIEPCAGTREEGETALMTAQRELKEEMGFVAHQWSPPLSFHSSPGFLTEVVHLFFATQLEKGYAEPEETEDIEVIEIGNPEGILEYLHGPRLTDLSAKTLVALLWFLQFVGREETS